MKVKTVNILGSKWLIKFLNESCDGAYGTADYTSRVIKIYGPSKDIPDEGKFDNWDKHLAVTLRHELVHAFMFESGLGDSWDHPKYGHEELTVDWFARIYPKFKEVCDSLDV